MFSHIPVLLKEVIYLLDIKPGKKYIDATLGLGGHAEAILKEGGQVLGVERHEKTFQQARKRLKACPGVFKAVLENFSNLQKIAVSENWSPVSGILFDLGVNSWQLDYGVPGLSFQKDEVADMRLSESLAVTAADLVNTLPERELKRLFWEYAQERYARGLAREIVQERVRQPITTTSQLREIAKRVYRKPTKIDPATKLFLSLRLAVNSELENLNEALPQAVALLERGGRLVVISFHSGEDRIVKHFFKTWQAAGEVRVLTKKPLVPSEQERQENPRSRSAKARCVEKL